MRDRCLSISPPLFVIIVSAAYFGSGSSGPFFLVLPARLPALRAARMRACLSVPIIAITFARLSSASHFCLPACRLPVWLPERARGIELKLDMCLPAWIEAGLMA